MIQLAFPFPRPLTASQKRSIDFLVSAKGWPRERAVCYFERHNQGVANRKLERMLKTKRGKQ